MSREANSGRERAAPAQGSDGAAAQVDAYIENAAEFARPILKKIRRVFQKACPDIVETIKWGAPCFEKGGIVGGMAAFQRHASVGFWHSSLLKDSHGRLGKKGAATFGSIRLEKLADIPPDAVLLDYIRQGVELNERGVKGTSRKKSDPKRKLDVPDYFMAALRRSNRALASFEGFSDSQRKEYVEWVREAKQVATRERRIATAIEWLAEGKPRNWKYMRKKA